MHDQPSAADGEARTRTRRTLRLLLGAAAAIVMLGALSFALLGGSSKTALPGGARESAAGHGFLGTLALPVKRAPSLALRNYLGQPVTLAQYSGKAVLVTFLYANCPDVCPLIAANLRVALNELGPEAARVQVIAVSVDPRGDTPAAVAKFLRAHELLGRMQYLRGSHAQLARAWAAWGVGSQQDVGQPQLVAHSALVYGIGASGDLRTVYPSSFEPRQIAHDVPLLAKR
ncbi:MAG TPA: SCO family protein [Solirubrobacteraceae bacterium]|jgi:protein SCO1/2|nr:SCO family protein [Solirubrobacteraceae bacterium]